MAHIQREGNEGLTLKLTLDTSDAVAALKRLQRAARETTRELREVETGKFFALPLSKYTTRELADELARRAQGGEQGISTFEVGEGKDVEDGEELYFVGGPAKVIVVYEGGGE